MQQYLSKLGGADYNAALSPVLTDNGDLLCHRSRISSGKLSGCMSGWPTFISRDGTALTKKIRLSLRSAKWCNRSGLTALQPAKLRTLGARNE